MADQNHDESQNRDSHDEAGKTEELADQQYTRDGDHRGKIHLPLHHHRRDEIGLDQMDSDAQRCYRQSLGKAEDAQGEQRRNQSGQQGSEEGHDGGDPRRTRRRPGSRESRATTVRSVVSAASRTMAMS